MAEQGVPEQTPAPEPVPAPQAARRTRISGIWVAIGCFAVIVVLLLIFIVQNDQRVDISYLGFHARTRIGVGLLFAAILGVLLTVLAGTARILQLRRSRAQALKTDPTRRTASRS
jgi:uncharacterized integral membrane protein